MNVATIAGLLRERAQLRAHDGWTRDEVLAYQARRLADLRAHATAHSPFYRDLHRGLERAPLSALPVVTKATLMERFDDLVTDRDVHLAEVERYLVTASATDRFRGRYRVAATGGTTGRRGIFLADAHEWTQVLASYGRAYEWAGVAAGLTNRIRMAVVSSTNPTHQSSIVGATVASRFIPTLRLDASQPIEGVVAALNAFRPDSLVGYASILRILAEEQAAGRLRLTPRAVMSVSEVLTADTRERIRSAFGVPATNVYAATETAGIASECRLGHLHRYEDLVIAEVVDEDNEPVPEGEYGAKTLVTVLFSRTQPLIRYELSDRIAAAPGMPGDLPFSLLVGIEGREEEVLTLGGVTVHPNVFHGALERLAVAGWQVVDEGGRVRVLLAGAANVDAALTAEAVRHALEQVGAHDIPVVVDLMDAIPRTARQGPAHPSRPSRGRRTLDAMGHHGHHPQDLAERTEHLEEATGTAPAGEHGGHEMSAGGHDRHDGHSVAMFRDRFWLSLALIIPVVLLSHDIQEWVGYSIPMIAGIEYLPAILGTIVFFYGGLVFLRGAQGELADRKPGMMTLISLAIVVAFVTSWAGTLGFFDVEIWWELATLITIMLLGHWLEMRSIAQARGALAALAELLPDTAERVTATGTEEVPIGALALGDVVLVRPGARVPVDGVVTEGNADVDESMITGESKAVAKEPGDAVVAGTVAAGGSLRVRVTAIGDATALSGIMRLVAAAQASGSRAQALADKAAAILFYVALAAGSITLVFWWLQGDPEGALVRTATVLVIACPHALGLAIPLVIAISTSLGARNGLLVKDRLALERARTLNTIIFDKTGTLTKGEPVLIGASAPDALRLAVAVEADSEHPLARAIVQAAKARGMVIPTATAFEALPGRGARARVEGHDVAVGGPRLLAEMSLAPLPVAADWDRQGRTVLHVVVDGQVAGEVAIEDEVRPESKDAVEALHALGIRVAMITGDSQAVADSVARRLGIDEVAAQVLPADKAAAVKRFQEGGRKVAMVGDGVNDAPALATADVGIAIGAGTDVAVESAGIVLVRNDPRDVVAAIELSRATYTKMIQNLIWATGYNLVAIPVAAGVLVPFGIDLPMSVGAIAMSASTIVVAANAQLLRRVRLRREPIAQPRLATA